MSESTTQNAATENTEEPAQAPVETPAETDWKSEARKWEQRAKENSNAAQRLAEIEEANKSEAQKAADREAAATQRAVEAEARAARRDVALEHGLSKDDAALLDNLTDEEAMKALAVRLASASERGKTNRVPGEGANPKSKEDPMQEFTRRLFKNPA